MNRTDSTVGELIPFSVIAAAADGNVSAINAVLRHYSKYITALATRKLYDEYGNLHFCVDEEMRRRLETKLITKVLEFEVA